MWLDERMVTLTLKQQKLFVCCRASPAPANQTNQAARAQCSRSIQESNRQPNVDDAMSSSESKAKDQNANVVQCVLRRQGSPTELSPTDMYDGRWSLA